MKKVTKAAQRDYMRNLLSTNEKAAIRALLIVYDNQTTDERSIGGTQDLNGIGFTGTDGEILSSFSVQFLDRGFLSPRQKEILMGKMKKYWKQILMVSDIDKVNQAIISKG